MSDNKDTYDPLVYQQAWEEWEKIEVEERIREVNKWAQESFEREFWEELVENPRQIASMPEDEKTYDVCLFVVRLDGRLLEYVPEELKTEEMCRTAIGATFYPADVLPFFPVTMDREVKQKLCTGVTRERAQNREA
jgi:hypothetical protein